MSVGRIDRRHAVLSLGLGLGLAAAGCSNMAGSTATAVAQDYSTALRNSLRPFTGELAGYRFRSTPLGNFGVGAVYLDEVQGADPSRAEGGWYLGVPDNWLAQGRSQASRAEWRERLVSQGSFGAFHLDTDRRREVEATLGAAVFVALGVDAKLDYSRGARLSFHAGEVRNRRLNWAEFSAALAEGLVAPAVAEVVRSGRFIITAADLVLLDFGAEVTVDETVNPALAATLRAKSAQPRVKDAVAIPSLSMRDATRGRFVASSNQPLVAAVLLKRPPPRTKSGPLAADVSAWPAAEVGNAAIDAVESRVLQSSL